MSKAQSKDYTAVEAAAEQRFARLKVDREHLFSSLDSNQDSRVSFDEVAEYRRRFRPFDNPSQALKLMDKDGDQRIAPGEFLGAPQVRTFWLGTDHLGRDVLTRIFYGFRSQSHC